MIWLGIDFETTGLDVTKERITEVGAVMWDPIKRVPLRIVNFFVWNESYPAITPEITAITGIEPDYYKHHHLDPLMACKTLASLMEKSDYIVAHNGSNFDFPLLKNEWARNAGSLPFVSKPTIDTSVDLPFPDHISTRKLVHLAAEHDFLNPFAHRAVFDVLTMLKITSRYSHEEIIKYASSKSVTVRAMVTKAEKDKAKNRGYRWDAANYQWIKTLKEFQIADEKEKAGFEINVI